MRDEHFELFIDEFGEATTRVPAPESSVEFWRGKLPSALLDYWQGEGWSGYANGLFWLVNPSDYEEVLSQWITGTPLAQIDNFHVIARTAFGKLYLWGEKTGPSARLTAWDHSFLCLDRDLRKPLRDANLALRGVFSGTDRLEADTLDVKGRPLFDQSLRAVGKIGPDEMYGFEPAIVAGGQPSVKNIHIVKIIEHLGMLRQLAGPQFPMGSLNTDKLL